MPRSTCTQPPLVTLFLFVVVYVRLVLDPTLGKTKKLISAVVNGCAAALAACYVLSLHGPPRNEGSFSAVIIFVVVIPALFTLTAALILYSQTVGYFAATAAVFLAWAYLAWFAVALWIFPSFYPDMLERTRLCLLRVAPDTRCRGGGYSFPTATRLRCWVNRGRTGMAPFCLP